MCLFSFYVHFHSSASYIYSINVALLQKGFEASSLEVKGGILGPKASISEWIPKPLVQHRLELDTIPMAIVACGRTAVLQLLGMAVSRACAQVAAVQGRGRGLAREHLAAEEGRKGIGSGGSECVSLFIYPPVCWLFMTSSILSHGILLMQEKLGAT